MKNVANNIYVIIPSLNPDEKLKNTVRGMLDAGFERIIIVNDHSTPPAICVYPAIMSILKIFRIRMKI